MASLTESVVEDAARLNPELPAEALEDAFRKLTRPEGADPIQGNRLHARRRKALGKAAAGV